MQTGGSMNRKYIPNILTALRMLGAVLLLLTKPLTLPFYLLHIFCGLTDALDGAFARALHASSRLGAQLDSIADLMFYGVMMGKLMPIRLERMPASLWWIVGAAVFIRLCAYGVAAVKYRRFAALHTWMNKLTGAAVFAVPCILPLKAFVPLCAVFCGIAALAALEELLIHICSEEYRADRRSIFSAL